MIVRKGFRPSIDSYSAFFENDHLTVTGLEGVLELVDGRKDRHVLSEHEEQAEQKSTSLRKRIRVSPVAGQGTYGLSGTIKF